MPELIRELGVLEERIGYTFSDGRLLQEALTHPSAVKEGKFEGPDNQRLEFLGDAVLQLVASDLLMRHFEDEDEGHLSFMRAELVRKENLSILADRLGLLEFIRWGPSLESAEEVAFISISADALEAVLGAIFLDGGWAAAREVTREIIGVLQKPDEDMKGLKSVLQEIIQKRFGGEVPEYVVQENPEGNSENRFLARVFHRNRLLGAGEGRSKKKAEEAAAHQALDSLRGQKSP